MCVAYPGKVIETDGNMAKVDFSGNIVDVNVALVDVKIDDWVLVHAGMATCSMSEEKAKELLEIFEELRQ